MNCLMKSKKKYKPKYKSNTRNKKLKTLKPKMIIINLLKRRNLPPIPKNSKTSHPTKSLFQIHNQILLMTQTPSCLLLELIKVLNPIQRSRKVQAQTILIRTLKTIKSRKIKRKTSFQSESNHKNQKMRMNLKRRERPN